LHIITNNPSVKLGTHCAGSRLVAGNAGQAALWACRMTRRGDMRKKNRLFIKVGVCPRRNVAATGILLQVNQRLSEN